MTIKVALAVPGAFGIKHLDGIRTSTASKSSPLISRDLDNPRKWPTSTASARHHRPGRQPGHAGSGRRDPVHAHADARQPDQSPAWKPASTCRWRSRCATAGRWRGGGEAKQTGLVAMCGHTAASTPATSSCTRRSGGEFNIQQMDVQTYFFRRTNMNALGQPRSWTDHLLWHHARHTVDLFAYQAGSPIVQGQRHPGPDPQGSGHCHGHEHPAPGGQRRHLHAEPELQQRRPAGHLLPLHRRHRHLHRRYDDLVERQGKRRHGKQFAAASTCMAGHGDTRPQVKLITGRHRHRAADRQAQSQQLAINDKVDIWPATTSPNISAAPLYQTRCRWW